MRAWRTGARGRLLVGLVFVTIPGSRMRARRRPTGFGRGCSGRSRGSGGPADQHGHDGAGGCAGRPGSGAQDATGSRGVMRRRAFVGPQFLLRLAGQAVSPSASGTGLLRRSAHRPRSGRHHPSNVPLRSGRLRSRRHRGLRDRLGRRRGQRAPPGRRPSTAWRRGGAAVTGTSRRRCDRASAWSPTGR